MALKTEKELSWNWCNCPDKLFTGHTIPDDVWFGRPVNTTFSKWSKNKDERSHLRTKLNIILKNVPIVSNKFNKSFNLTEIHLFLFSELNSKYWPHSHRTFTNHQTKRFCILEWTASHYTSIIITQHNIYVSKNRNLTKRTLCNTKANSFTVPGTLMLAFHLWLLPRV